MQNAGDTERNSRRVILVRGIAAARRAGCVVACSAPATRTATAVIAVTPVVPTALDFRTMPPTFSNGRSSGGLVQTGPHITPSGTLGEQTPPSARQAGTHDLNFGGMKSTQH